MYLKSILHRVSGRRFKPLRPKTRWQDNPQFSSYIKEQISPDYEAGVHGAIRAATGNKSLQHGISVGSGTGDNERGLIAAGLVESFDLFEVSKDRIAQSKALAEKAGVSDRLTHHLDDALQRDFAGTYDLVYWEHSLHHMFDVDHALAWSVRALKPSGLLVVNDYVGPTRLQWRRQEVSLVRQFLRQNESILDVNPRRVRHGSAFRRLKQFLRDPSEAPQSDRIEAAYERHTGAKIKALGGAVIHLGGGFLNGAEDKDPMVHDRMIALDQAARDQGLSHFAFGLWCKPEQSLEENSAAKLQRRR